MQTERIRSISTQVKKYFTIFAMTCILVALYLASRYNYLLFHSLAEIFSIVIACGIFIIAWNSRQFVSNGYLLFLGIAFLFIGLLDLLHTFSYKGMSFFPNHDSDLPTQLWIAARYLQSVSFLCAPFLLRRRIEARFIFAGYSLVTFILIFSIFTGLFPSCYIEGVGLTPFKIASEYIISAILLASIILLFHYRLEFDPKVLRLIVWSLVLAIASEFSFTFYLNVYDLFNLIGHYLKILSFYIMYKAIIETALRQPYNLLFRGLKQSEERYNSLFEHMIDGFARHRILLDDKGQPIDYIFLEVNMAFEEQTGLNRKDIIGKRITEVLPGIENDPTDWIGVYGKVALTGNSARFESYSEKLGKWYSIIAYSPEKGSFATVSKDITQHKQMEEALEAKVRERTAELERSNRELQDFAFVASHDLQEPLRKIRTFGDLLITRAEIHSNDRRHLYITRMRESAGRMQSLLRSLLEYSRVTSREKPREKVELGRAVEEALSNLEMIIHEKEASVAVEKLPVIEGDYHQIVQLFQNVIANALKFQRPDETPQIRVYQNKIDDQQSPNKNVYQIMVEDNGVGFSERYLSKIFMPFQRLHGKDEFKGVGIGLTICKKIVERHGGSITVRSSLGKGSTFIITLPEMQGIEG